MKTVPVKLVIPDPDETFKPFVIAPMDAWNKVWDALPPHSRMGSHEFSELTVASLLLSMVSVTPIEDAEMAATIASLLSDRAE